MKSKSKSETDKLLTDTDQPLSDEEIVTRLQQSYDKQLYGLLFDRYSDKVYRTCLSMVGDQYTAEDLTHDIFVKILMNLKKFDFRSGFTTWIYRISNNFCIDYLRSHKRKIEKEIDYTEELTRNKEDENEKELLSVKAELLVDVLNQLEPDEKLILLLKYQEDKSIQEITELMELSESAVKMRLKRTKAKAVTIKRSLEGKYGQSF